MLGRRSVRTVTAVLALGFAVSACKGESHLEAYRPSPTTTSVTAPPTTAPSDVPPAPKIALAAVANGSVVNIHPAAGDSAVSKVLANPTFEGMPLAMLAIDRQGDWLQVRFPERPNGSIGWIQASEVTLTPVENRIVISISKRSLRVLDKNQQVVYETNVAVGKPRTPTPTGRFYEDIWLPNPGRPYGSFMLSIAGFSDVLHNFGGGRGQIAMHGWADTSVMGQAASNGCIRMRSADISHVASLAPVGTPVDIVN